jgi:nucleolar protein 53
MHIALAAVPSPHEGTSYNPSVAAHTSLLQKAVEAEERMANEEAELRRTKEQMERARRIAQEEVVLGIAPGMEVQEIAEEDKHDNAPVGVPAKKIPERKTKRERRKIEKLRAEVCCSLPSYLWIVC